MIPSSPAMTAAGRSYHHPHERRAAFQIFRRRIFRQGADLFAGNSQNPEGVGAHRVNHVPCGLQISAIRRRASISKAPLTITILFPSICWTVVSSFLSESKGRSARRGSCFPKASLGIPFLWAARTMAVSAGRRYAAPGRHGSSLHAGQISFSEHPGSFPLKCQMKILLICPM